MKELPLTRGKVALVDDADFDWLNQWKWYASEAKPGRFYAVRFIWLKERGAAKIVSMHRELLKVGPSIKVDHKNGNGLDNQRHNIRAATDSQNSANQFKKSGCTSKYKGVTWDRARRKWAVAIKQNGIKIHLGRFDDEKVAALTYDEAASKLFGEFAKLNLSSNDGFEQSVQEPSTAGARATGGTAGLQC